MLALPDVSAAHAHGRAEMTPRFYDKREGDLCDMCMGGPANAFRCAACAITNLEAELADALTRLSNAEKERDALRLLEGMEAIEVSVLGTFLQGGDIPATVDAARGAIVRRMLEAERRVARSDAYAGRQNKKLSDVRYCLGKLLSDLAGHKEYEYAHGYIESLLETIDTALAENPNAHHVAGVTGSPARADTVPSSAVGVANERECGSNPPDALPSTALTGRSKEWWLERAWAEGDTPVSAGADQWLPAFIEAVRKLTFMGRTTGGWSRDDDLCAALDAVEELLPPLDSHARVERESERERDTWKELAKNAEAEVIALRDQLDDWRGLLDLIREALNVPTEPHQTLQERMLAAAQRWRCPHCAISRPHTHTPQEIAELSRAPEERKT
jgi:hypothetical protein